MEEWKRQSSLAIRDWYRTVAPNYACEFGESRRFWLPKYYSFEIYEEAKLEEKLNYIHQNPVRWGLVTQTTDWRWSSARWYQWGRDVGVPIEWVP